MLIALIKRLFTLAGWNKESKKSWFNDLLGNSSDSDNLPQEHEEHEDL